jgi:hypothetical protein
MLGLRPRLQQHRSLLEFITNKSFEELSDLKLVQVSLGLPELLEDGDGVEQEDLDESSFPPKPKHSTTSIPSTFSFPQPLNYLPSSVRTYRRMPAQKESELDDQHGAIFSISGPVIVAENMTGVAMYELCKVGHDELVGEVIRIEADKATIQVYEETGASHPRQLFYTCSSWH